MATTRVFAATLLFFLIKIQLSAQNFETYISKNNPEIKEWASGCRVIRGYINISDTTQTYSGGGITSNRATFGSDSLALGIADGVEKVLSLGDGGSAVLTFAYSIMDGNGTDFAIFENGIESATQTGYFFLEPAFVEVSSDGINFFRFPSLSETQTDIQVNAFGNLNPEALHNLAGNAPLDYGTPFDLSEMKEIDGLDVTRITHIKIIDIPGSILPQFAQFDSHGNEINAPFPTPFNTCGFDLNAVAVIHTNENAETEADFSVRIFPIPALSAGKMTIEIQSESSVFAEVIDIFGHCVYLINLPAGESFLKLPDLMEGIYILKLKSNKSTRKYKFFIG